MDARWYFGATGVIRAAMISLALLVWSASAEAGDLKSRLESADAVVWAGVDYSRAVFMVPETFDNPEERTYYAPRGTLPEEINRYSKPDQAWKDLTEDWNTIAQEALHEKLESALQREIEPDLPDAAGFLKRLELGLGVEAVDEQRRIGAEVANADERPVTVLRCRNRKSSATSNTVDVKNRHATSI